MITIIDYRAGNLASVRKAFTYLGCVTQITSDPDIVARAERLVLPGVGNFRATAHLEADGMRAAIAEAVRRGIPFLGICLGMQWLFEGSEEAPDVPGLGAFAGRCAKFPAGVKAPHVGWNEVRPCAPSRLFSRHSAFVYYTHSYRAPVGPGTVACTDYGGAFTAAVERGNIFGVQFHPEKSDVAGLALLRNFLEAPC